MNDNLSYTKCKKCFGTGQRPINVSINPQKAQIEGYCECASCHGTGEVIKFERAPVDSNQTEMFPVGQK
jgi:DnaJ-class molecular chaperone